MSMVPTDPEANHIHIHCHKSRYCISLKESQPIHLLLWNVKWVPILALQLPGNINPLVIYIGIHCNSFQQGWETFELRCFSKMGKCVNVLPNDVKGLFFECWKLRQQFVFNNLGFPFSNLWTSLIVWYNVWLLYCDVINYCEYVYSQFGLLRI